MIIEQFNGILERINGCTFASIDAETKVGGLRKVTLNEQVILFTNKNGSGYENMVRRRLAEYGKDPESFVVGDLPWGERIPGTPIIKHRGFLYIQTIFLKPGDTTYFLGNTEIAKADLGAFGIKSQLTSQGLPQDKQVLCHTYALDNITGIRILGERLPKKTLGIRA